MAIIHQTKEALKRLLPNFLIDKYHLALSFLGAFWYRFPSRLRPRLRHSGYGGREGYGGQAKKLTVIAVTGTNGKTTTIDLIAKILEEAGSKAAVSSSIKFKIGGKTEPNLLKMTMPGRFKLQKFLRRAVNSGCKYAVLEVTSEGIKQHRHRFIGFDTALLTNLAPEHIEAHGGFENYRRAKLELFKRTKKIHIVNLDDKNAEYFLKIPAAKKYGYSIQNSQSYQNTSILQSMEVDVLLKAKKPEVIPQGIYFEVDNQDFKLKLLGEFNIYNALAAICVGLSQGIDLATCQKALAGAGGIPGRMEKVISTPFEVFVDYAFTPNALEKVYQTLKPQNAQMICVLGACGGGRDKWKRPVLGQLAGKYCDRAIVTNEDPYDEEPMEIIEQVASGAEKAVGHAKSNQQRALRILDRREAIRKALSLAKPGDKVIITGKGSEPWLCVAGGKKIPWDDRQVVREELKKIQTSKL